MKVAATLTPDAVSKLKESDFDKYGTLPDAGLSCEIEYEFGKTTEEAVEIFSDEVCLNMIVGHILFTLQGKMRSWLSAGKTQEEIQSMLYDADEDIYFWKPTIGGARKSEEEKLEEKLRKLDPAKREAQIQAMQELLAKMQAE